MNYRKVLTIQDISCVGQCSLTVALPILSACGLETCILPSAVLSTHTGGFKGFTFRDLSEDMPGIARHWEQENIRFSGIYTGYLGSSEQIAYVKDIMNTLLLPGGVRIVDPAMADNGKLYTGFTEAFAKEMGTLVAESDITLPNVTEACFMTGETYKEEYDEAYIRGLLHKLTLLGAKKVVLTGIGYEPGQTGVVVYEDGEMRYYAHQKIANGCHGTGDIYASAFTGAYLQGKDIFSAAKIAADYTVSCIETTAKDPGHWYGAEFEPTLGELIAAVRA